MQSRLRVSVVVPVYRRQREVSFALASLESEADLIDEIVVVDDASPEPITITAPPAVADKIRLIRLGQNLGSSGARQRGVEHATGDVIAFLDSDDAWLPGKLAAQLPLIDRAEMVAVVCAWQLVDLDRGTMTTRFPVPASDPVTFASGCWFAPGTTAIVPRAAFSRVGGLWPELRRLEDFDWFLRFALAGGRMVVAPYVGAMIRREAKSNRRIVSHAAGLILDRYNADERTSPRLRRHLKAWLDVEVAAACWSEGDRTSAIAMMLRSMWNVPRTGVQLQHWWRNEPPRFSREFAEGHLGL